MARHRVILDCDPGVDDAIAILLALGSPEEIELLGITCVAGNLPLATTERNARRILSLAGRTDIPVFAGCSRPILPREGRVSIAHGEDGLGDIGLAEASCALAPQHAVDYLIERILAEPGEVTLCVTGPMTNVALALIKEPRIAQALRQIVFMGGAAFCPGNITPWAEFNFYIDPHAAEAVLASGAPLTMVSLDLTNQAMITPERLDLLKGGPDEPPQGSLAWAAVAMLRAYGVIDASLHDPCVMAWLVAPELFTTLEAHMSVDSSSPSALGLGRSLVAVRPRHLKATPPNGQMVMSVEADGLFRLIGERLARVGAP